MLLPLLVGLIAARKPFDFYSEGPYEPAVPRPESILRYQAGEHTTTFRDQEAVLNAIVAAAKDRVSIENFGYSVEGRPLKVLIFTSPKNRAKLGAIQADHRSLASGTGDPKKTLPIVWINECIHGDETASFESAMWTAYTLAASKSPKIMHALDNAVVILNPVYNPDGHERYTVYYDSIATGSPDPQAFENNEPRTIYGRLNHYRFDMNRDRVAFSQDETRQEFAEMLKWNPQVYIDQHGQVASYFFPPEPMSVNPNVDRVRNSKWTDIFGRATAAAFDKNGFSYFVKDTFDLYYPGYIDSSNTLTGAIGMTHETDGGRTLAQKREDGSVVTLRQGAAKHFTAALAVVETAADHGQELLGAYAEFKKKVVSGAAAGKFQRVVVTSPDARPLIRLQQQLSYAGIQSSLTDKGFSEEATDYWTGKKGKHEFSAKSLVVDMAQPQGALAKALLEPGQSFEPEFIKAQAEKKKSAPDGETYPGPESAEFYDLTGWSLPLAHDLQAYWGESVPAAPMERQRVGSQITGVTMNSSIGYVLPYRDQEDILCVAEAMAQGVHAMVTTKSMSLGKVKFERGSFLFLADHNDDNYSDILIRLAQRHGSVMTPLSTAYPDEGTRTGPGSESTLMIKPPCIGVAFGAGENMASAGGIWFLMDRVFHLPFTPLSNRAFGEFGDLSKYTALVIPEGTGLTINQKIKDWVSGGGNLVVLGAGNWALGSSGFVTLDQAKGDFQDLPGSLFKAELDPRSYLSYGYPAPETGKIPLAVPISGSTFYQVRKEGGSVVCFPADEKESKLLSGWEWPDETEKALAGTVVLQDVPVGRGHVVIFFTDPTDRAMWPGLYKLLLNAMILSGAAQ